MAANLSVAVDLRYVTKLFGEVKAVDGVSLQIAAGRTVALLGPSGCGKTTTLRLINRLEDPTAWQVLVRGQDVRGQRREVLRRSIGYVMQDAGLFPHWNVAANVGTVPHLLGWSAPRLRERVREVLDLVGLPEATFGRRMPNELSGGQRQRVGVARALAANPDVLLMDEPFGALDPGTRESIKDEFLRLNARLKKTVVLVTHDVTEAGKLADEIVLLDCGRVMQRGSLRELLVRPAGAAVRNFFGGRGPAVALEALRLRHLLVDLPTAPAGAAQTFVFLSLTLRGLGLALLLGLPMGILISRRPRLAGLVIAVLAVMQTVPSLVLVGLLIPWLGIGPPAALFAAVAYSMFPIVMNTCVGIAQVAPAVRDAAYGMGMTGRQVLWHVELPLALPVMLAGIRAAAVYASAIVAIGAFVGAGGLGDFIFTGLSRGDNGLMALGALPILFLTLLLFWSLGLIAWLAKKNSTLGMALGGGLIVALSLYAVAGLFRPNRADLRIGAKDFTEGQILAELLKQVAEDRTGLRVQIVPNLGTGMILKALQHGQIDLYPEYTGVLLTNKDALGMDVPADRSRITALVRMEMQKRFGLALLEPFGLNNTYALCLTRNAAQVRKLEKISDLRDHSHLRVVVDVNFLERPDGWPGLVAKYNLRFEQPPQQVAPDLLYRALENEKADLIVGFATDWQIEALDLVVLDDDLGYFPSYLGAPLMRDDVLARYPQLRPALEQLSGKIDDRTMRRLNYEVAVKRRSEAEVVREFLLRQGVLAAKNP